MDDAAKEQLKPEEVVARLETILERLLAMQDSLEGLLNVGDAEAIERLMRERQEVGAPLAELSALVESRTDRFAEHQTALKALAAKSASLSQSDAAHLARMSAMRDEMATELRRMQSARSIQSAYVSEAGVVPTLQDREA
jgi:cell pole-organizing protein PopZ